MGRESKETRKIAKVTRSSAGGASSCKAIRKFETMNIADRREYAASHSEKRIFGSTTLLVGDARSMNLPASSVHLVVTSPPYFNIKDYAGGNEKQLGSIMYFNEFVAEMAKVISECFRVLVPGGRLCLNVGDICLSRKVHGRHRVLPLHAYLEVAMQEAGFDLLAPIIWAKIGNASREAGGAGGFLGKPYEPNAVIKNDIEYILIAKKPGPYRSPSEQQRLSSMIGKDEFKDLFRQVWTFPGTSTKTGHPAPFPEELPRRLVTMYSFAGDVVLDPFMGSGTTALAACKLGRQAIGIDCVERFVDMAATRLVKAGIETKLDGGKEMKSIVEIEPAR